MGDWEPDKRETVTKGCDGGFCSALLWTVPAKVQGIWKADQGKLILEQKYQKISGTLNSERITDGLLSGNEISFKVKNDAYKGTVNGKLINGSVSSDKGIRNWTASLQ
jgi:hypothetical protein